MRDVAPTANDTLGAYAPYTAAAAVVVGAAAAVVVKAAAAVVVRAPAPTTPSGPPGGGRSSVDAARAARVVGLLFPGQKNKTYATEQNDGPSKVEVKGNNALN